MKMGVNAFESRKIPTKSASDYLGKSYKTKKIKKIKTPDANPFLSAITAESACSKGFNNTLSTEVKMTQKLNK